jgi:hypothetical protein
MNRTGPSFNADRISEKIRPGRSEPSEGVKAFTGTFSRVLEYSSSRFSILSETSIEGEKPVKTKLTFSNRARKSATSRVFHPGERIS